MNQTGEDRDEDGLGRFTVGPTSPAFWRGVVELQYDRLRTANAASAVHDWPRKYPIAARDAFAVANIGWAAGRYVEALLLLTAIRRLELVAARIGAHTGDEAIAAALVRFREDGPHAKDLRDVLEHLDEYAVGQGRHPRTGAQVHWWPRIGQDVGRTFATIGELHVDLDAAAAAALELAHTSEHAWRKHRIQLGSRRSGWE